MKSTVAMCPVDTAAIATGEIAYKKAAGTEIHELDVRCFKSLDAVNIMTIGAIKKNVVTKN